MLAALKRFRADTKAVLRLAREIVGAAVSSGGVRKIVRLGNEFDRLIFELDRGSRWIAKIKRRDEENKVKDERK
jgi:hypothetical protein